MWIALSLSLLFVSIVLFKFSTILACIAFGGCCWATSRITAEDEGEFVGLIIVVVIILVLITASLEGWKLLAS